jgi:hypothetical protein
MADVKLLPPEAEIETRRVLKQLSRSHRALAELKGFTDVILNKNILINAVTINEAKVDYIRFAGRIERLL